MDEISVLLPRYPVVTFLLSFCPWGGGGGAVNVMGRLLGEGSLLSRGSRQPKKPAPLESWGLSHPLGLGSEGRGWVGG